MSKAKQVPSIRFKGYGDEWGKNLLSQIVDVRSGCDYKHLKKGTIPVYGTGGYMLSVNEALSYKDDAIGIGRKGTIDNPFILKAPFWTVDTLFYSVPKEKNDLKFIYNIFQNIDWKQKDESTGVPSLSKLTINAISVSLPDKTEQSKIGTFFSSLDGLITKQQQKHDKLTTLKKAMLKKMFPQNGTLIPEIRFKGFTEEWEESVLSKLIDFIVDNRGRNPDYYCKAGIPVIDNFMIKNNCYPNLNEATRFIDDNLYENFIRKYNKYNDVIITLVGNGIGNVTLFPNKKSVIIQNTLGLRFLKNKIFMFYSLISNQNKICLLNRGMAQPSIRQDELLEICIKFPADLEQEKIGHYFSNLDNLISLEQKQIDKLKNIKKACLEKMFV